MTRFRHGEILSKVKREGQTAGWLHARTGTDAACLVPEIERVRSFDDLELRVGHPRRDALELLTDLEGLVGGHRDDREVFPGTLLVLPELAGTLELVAVATHSFL